MIRVFREALENRTTRRSRSGQRARGIVEVHSGFRKEIEVLGGAMSEVIPPKGCAAGQKEPLLESEEGFAQFSLQGRQPVRRAGGHRVATPR